MQKSIKKTVISLGMSLATLTALPASADIYFVNTYVDNGLSAAIIGDAVKLGKTSGFANDIPYDKAVKLLLPGWKVINRVKYPDLYVSWTKGTPKIEVLQEMNRKGKLIFYIDQPKHEVTIDLKP